MGWIDWFLRLQVMRFSSDDTWQKRAGCKPHRNSNTFHIYSLTMYVTLLKHHKIGLKDTHLLRWRTIAWQDWRQYFVKAKKTFLSKHRNTFYFEKNKSFQKQVNVDKGLLHVRDGVQFISTAIILSRENIICFKLELQIHNE